MKDEATRIRLLESASKEFFDKGFSGARMQSIADNADVNKAMIHYYFENKDGLYLASLKFNLKKFQEEIEGAVSKQKNLEDFISDLTTAFFRFHKNCPGFIKLILREIIEGTAFLNKLKRDDGIPSLMKAFESQVQLMQKNYIIRDDIEPFQIILTIMGNLGATMIQSLAFATITGEDFDKFLEKRQVSFQKILVNGLKAGKGSEYE